MLTLFISKMTLARFSTIILIFILNWKASSGQQNTLGSQQVQNTAGFGPQNANQNADLVNFNIQMQQNAKQAGNTQQSLHLQQLSNIPMQTFNVQQPVNFQHQSNSQPVNFQPISQPINFQQQGSQPINLQQEVPQPVNRQQTLSHSANLQQSTVVQPINPQQSSNGNLALQYNLQQSMPIQQLPINLQPQTNPLNLQQSQVQAVNSQTQTSQYSVNLQPQTSQNSVHLQQPMFVQPVSIEQQAAPHPINLQQQAAPQSVYAQKSPVVQPVTYQQPVHLHDPMSATQLNLQSYVMQQPHTLQPTTAQQIDLQQQKQQQQIPCNNIGGYQVIAYQKPCQQSEIFSTVPMSQHLSKVSSNSNPAVMTAVPATIPMANAVKHTADNLYLISPQNYPTYTTAVMTDNFQPSSSGPKAVPIMTVANPVPSLATNRVTNNHNHNLQATENWSSSLKIPDLGSLNQLPIVSLLDQPTSSVQSALLSSILSSIQNPSTSSHYMASSSYPPQTLVSPQCNTQGSKLSLKSLLPLLLNLLQEKYTNCECRNCCNCDCSQNDNFVHEPQITTVSSYELEFKEKEDTPKIYEESQEEEEEDILESPQDHKKPRKYENIIPDDSTEIDDTEDSSGVDDDEDNTVDVGDEDS